MKQVHGMIDLETFNTKPSSAIIQIGFVGFTFERLESGEVDIDIIAWHQWDIAPQEHRTVSPSTVAWWFSEKRKDALLQYVNAPKVQLREALGGLASVINELKPKTIYSRGIDFDFSILDDAYTSFGSENPWHYGAKRDLRTLTAITNLKIEYDKVPHTAVEDCIFQVNQLGQVAANLGLERL
jgi:hypothetical protein